jgi:hypothetical protein
MFASAQVKKLNNEIAANEAQQRKLQEELRKLQQSQAQYPGVEYHPRTKLGHLVGCPINVDDSNGYEMTPYKIGAKNMPAMQQKPRARRRRSFVASKPGLSTIDWNRLQNRDWCLFLPILMENTEEEFARIRDSVYGHLTYHLNRGHLPPQMAVQCVLSQAEDGTLGVVVHRIEDAELID